MQKTLTDLAKLSESERQRVASWLKGFQGSWTEDRLAALVHELPPIGDSVRLPALLELVKLDLAEQWKHGKRVTVEGYLKNYPELGVPDTVPTSLVRVEYEVRAKAGLLQDLPHFARRFPRQAAELLPLPPNGATFSAPQNADATVEPRSATRTPAKSGSIAASLPEDFGRYRIVKKLGQGGMGSVYLAEDRQLERRVALKVPHITPEDGPGVLQRFYREARAAATLDHPNLCQIFDVGSHEEIPYLTMAYIEGRTLAHLIKGAKPMSVRNAAGIVRKLATALHEAHARGVIHRDLKPSNIMINQRGEPVVMDFGLARQSGSKAPRLTRLGAVMGTPSYMPPEQVKGDVEAMGPGCDIYSLGVMLYELLTGRVPFEGPVETVLGQILTQAPQPPSAHRADLDPRLDAICLRAMQKNIAARYPNMGELASALGDVMHNPAATAKKSAPAKAPQHAKQTMHPDAAPHKAAEDQFSFPLAIESQELAVLKPTATRSALGRWMLAAGVMCCALLVGAALLAWNLKPKEGVMTICVLLIQVNEPDAEILLNGKKRDVKWMPGGKSAALDVNPGQWIVQIAKKDFKTYEEKITMTSGERRSIEARLERISPPTPPGPDAILVVQVNEQDPTLQVDDEKAATNWDGAWSKTGEMKLKAGERTIRVSKDGFLPYENVVTLEAGERRTITVALAKTLPTADPQPLKLVLAADFSKNAFGFPIDKDNKNFDTEYANGQFRLVQKVDGLWWWPMPLGNLEFTDFVCEVEAQFAQKLNVPGGWGIGFTRNKPPTHPWTGIEVNNAGQVGVRLYDEAKPLVPFLKPKPMLPVTEKNTIRVEVKNKVIRFLVNGEQVAEKLHDRLLPSTLTLYMHGQPSVEVRFHRVRVWRMEGGEQPKPLIAEAWDKGIINSIGMKLAKVPPGDDLQGFHMGIYEVTQEQYERVIGENPSCFGPKGPFKQRVEGLDTRRFPVENVSWGDAKEFCRKLSELPAEVKAGRLYRLPTAREWQYACRAGTKTEYHVGNNLSSEQANINGRKSGDKTAQEKFLGRPTFVGSYPPNAFGLYDMHGNVSEYCNDGKALCGGSWSHTSDACKSNGFFPLADADHKNDLDGFRVICLVSKAKATADLNEKKPVDSPLAWPAEALKDGRIPAPDLRKLKRIVFDDFKKPTNNLPNAKWDSAFGGYGNGVYFMRDANGGRSWSYGETHYSDFVCEIVGRTNDAKGPGARLWGLGIANVSTVKENGKDKIWHRGIQIGIGRDGKVLVGPFEWDPDQGGGPWPAPIAHQAIKPLGEFNALMVVARKRQLEIYVNGVAVCNPITVSRDFTPGRLFFQGYKAQNELHVEFQRFQIWSVAGLPTHAEAVADWKRKN